jgi:hypothetical protein
MHRFLALAVAGAFLLAGCQPEEQPKHKFDHERRSSNVEDCRTQKTCPKIKPKTAFLLNGLFVYGKPGMMGAIQEALEQRGWKVTVLNHTDGNDLKEMPRVLIGHSMGANAALKRSQVFIKNHPDLIVSIDAGRAPLFHRAPNTKARTIDISCPWHPIGGQEIAGAAKKYEVCGTAHIAMPHDRRVLDIIIKEVEALDD